MSYVDTGYDDYLLKDAFAPEPIGDGALTQSQIDTMLPLGSVSPSILNSNWLSGEDLQSGSFVTGSSGWQIQGSGDVEFNSGVFRGSLIAGEIHVPDEDTTANSFHVDGDGNSWWGCTSTNFTADNDNATAYVLKTGIAKFQNVTLATNVTMNDLQAGSEISIQGWTSDLTFSATDYDTVAWTSGTITLMDTTTYSIDAGNTGNMSALTYIYLDIGVSTTVLQTSTSYSATSGQILIAVAEDNDDATSDATFQAFGGEGGLLLTTENLAANTVTANEILANTITAAEILANTITATEIAADTITTTEISIPNYFILPSDANLIGYWSFDDSSRGVAADSSVNENHGTISLATSTAGISGSALSFDGASGWVNVPADATIANIWTGGATAMAWIYPDSDGEGSFGRILDKDEDDKGWLFYVEDDDGSNCELTFYQRRATQSSKWRTTAKEITLGEWNHVAVVYDADNTANDPVFYVNGVVVAITEVDEPQGAVLDDSSDDLYIGNAVGDSRTFDGEIDEVRIYDEELSITEIEALYLNRTGPPTLRIAGGQIMVDTFFKQPDDADLAGYWALDEASGTTALDSTPNGNDGTLGTDGTSPSYAAGVSGTGVDFLGTGGYIQIPDDTVFEDLWDGGASVSVWVNADSDGEDNNGMICATDNGTNGWYISTVDESGGNLKIQFHIKFSATNGTWYMTNRGLSINTWHHVTVVYDADSVDNDPTMYLDGKKVAVTRSSTPVGTRNSDTTQNLYIGERNAADKNFDGTIDEVRFYTTELTEEEIKSLYFNPTGSQATIIGPGQITTSTLSAIQASVGTLDIDTDGHIKSGQTDYNTGTGFWIGDDSGTAKFSIGDADSAKLTWDGTDLDVTGVIRGAPFTMGLNFTIRSNNPPSTATTPSMGQNTAGDIALYYNYGGGGAFGDCEVEQRITSDNGCFFVFDAYGENTVLGAGAGADEHWIVDFAGTALISKYNNAAGTDHIYKGAFGADISGGGLTFSANASSGALTTDDTNVYILDRTDNVTVRRYTISGANITYQDNFTLAQACSGGFTKNGTSYYGRAGGTVYEFNGSGTVQQTLTISQTPFKTLNGVIIDDGRVYIVGYVDYNCYDHLVLGNPIPDYRPYTVTFIPMGAA